MGRYAQDMDGQLQAYAFKLCNCKKQHTQRALRHGED